MTVRAVDLQIVVQKTTEIMKSQQQENSKTRLQLQQQAQQLQQKEQIANHQVKDLQKADKNVLYRKKEQDGKREKGEQEQKKKKEQRGSEHNSLSTIDIKI